MGHTIVLQATIKQIYANSSYTTIEIVKLYLLLARKLWYSYIQVIYR